MEKKINRHSVVNEFDWYGNGNDYIIIFKVNFFFFMQWLLCPVSE